MLTMNRQLIPALYLNETGVVSHDHEKRECEERPDCLGFRLCESLREEICIRAKLFPLPDHDLLEGDADAIRMLRG
jgi:hypothetical protein